MQVAIFRALIVLVLTLPALVNAAEASPPNLVKQDLLKLQRQETRNLDSGQIEALNLQTFALLPREPVVNRPGERLKAVTYAYMEKMVRAHRHHPVIGSAVVEKYEQEGTEIGYCFGRAMFFHLALLKNGVDKHSIRKAWVVGPIGDYWQFHVATIVRGTNGEWWAVDPTKWQKPLRVEDWYRHWQVRSADGKLRFYITEPKKFTAELGRYRRVQLGLNLKAGNDWYKHYFADLLAWFASDKSAAYFEKMGVANPQVRTERN